ncbi:MAG: dCTP deaminase [Candidatus Nanoarchaeia archaeon]
MILTRKEILKEIKKGRIKIQPLNKNQIGPASIDLTLGDEFRIFKRKLFPYKVNEKADFEKLTRKRKTKRYITLHPNEFVLGITREKITLPDNICGWLSGRSKFARLGIAVHITADFINPGISNKQVLEIKNVSHVPLKLEIGTRVAQIVLERTQGKAKYVGSFSKQEHI